MTGMPPMPPPPAEPAGPAPAEGVSETLHAEAAVLGALLLGGDVTEARQTLPAATDVDGWMATAHRTVWDAISHVDDLGIPVDTVSVTQRLLELGRLAEVGGPAALPDLAAAAPPPSASGHWATTVADRAHRRRLHRGALHLIDAVTDPTIDPTTALADLDRIRDGAPTAGSLTLHLGDQLDRLPAPEWLVAGKIQRGLSFVWGREETGKSFVVIDLAAARAVGDRWHGMTVRPGRTLYLAAEGIHGAAQRLDAALAVRHADQAARRRVAMTSTPIDLTDGRDLARLDAAVTEHRADLIVLDTWARVAGIDDENDAAQTGHVIRQLDRLRARHGCDVIVIHHARKDGAELRGSGAIPAALDTAVRCTKSGNVITTESTKVKDGPAWDTPVRFALRPHGDTATLDRDVQAATVASDAFDVALADLTDKGTVLQASVRHTHGDQVLRRLKMHTDVRVDTDDRGRPILVAKQQAPF